MNTRSPKSSIKRCNNSLSIKIIKKSYTYHTTRQEKKEQANIGQCIYIRCVKLFYFGILLYELCLLCTYEKRHIKWQKKRTLSKETDQESEGV